jgi:hypothetical protein
MPEIITRDVGLSFSFQELEIAFPELKELERDSWEYYWKAGDLLEETVKKGEFSGFGFDEDCAIDEITSDEDGIYVWF